MPNSPSQAFKNPLKDQAILALIIAGLTILLGFVLAELQTKLGWGLLAVSLITVLIIFGMIIWLVQEPLQHILIALARDIRRLLEPKSIGWLLDTDQLASYELESNAPEIWLLTSDLLDDSQGGPFQTVVEKNLQKGKHYIYFVPNTPEIRARLEMVFSHHRNKQFLKAVYLPDSFFFLVPKLDIAIYNPLSKGKTVRCAFMGIPVPGQQDHYHASVSLDFIDKLVGTLLSSYEKEITS